MAVENEKNIEKAIRLIALCRECSRDNMRKAPVWLSHVRLGCGLESEFPAPSNEEVERQGDEYPIVFPSDDVFVERFYFIEDGDIVASVHECLECYSELIVRETEYDDMEVWHRGLSLLAEYCADKREVYWIVKREDKPPFLGHSTFAGLELLKRQKEDIFYPQYEFVRDCEDSNTSLDICSTPSNVNNAWIENPDNRWVIRWKNIFRDIESATQPLTIEPPIELQPSTQKKSRIRTKEQKILDEQKINDYCKENPDFTRKKIHEATGLSPATISRTEAWRINKAKRDEAKKKNKAKCVEDMKQFSQ